MGKTEEKQTKNTILGNGYILPHFTDIWCKIIGYVLGFWKRNNTVKFGEFSTNILVTMAPSVFSQNPRWQLHLKTQGTKLVPTTPTKVPVLERNTNDRIQKFNFCWWPVQRAISEQKSSSVYLCICSQILPLLPPQPPTYPTNDFEKKKVDSTWIPWSSAVERVLWSLIFSLLQEKPKLGDTLGCFSVVV